MIGDSKSQVSRRDFVKTAAAAAAIATTFPHIVRGAEPDKPLKVGVVGCGGRGTEAARNAMAAAKGINITMLADLYQDRVDGARANLAKHNMEVDPKHCFVGPNAYKKVVESDVDYVILAAPPYYRPEHLAACMANSKHVFMEKPVAVDPVGIRKIIDSSKAADAKKLHVVAGTQRRHQNSYIETIKKLKDGAIGKILSAQAYWCGGALWYRRREEGWSEMEWMHRDWVNWRWLSGDHVVEQHVHNLDVVNWVLGALPEKVVAMGGRQRRKTGDQFDNFAADLTYPGEVHVTSMCRQINDTATNVSERVIGDKGWSNCSGFISTTGKLDIPTPDPYVQEHARLIEAIRTGKAINEAQQVAESTMCAIMIRTAAYTGKEVSWEEMMKSDMELTPPDYELTEENCRAHVPVAGAEQA